MSLISILVVLVVIGVLLYLVTLIPMNDVIRKIILVLAFLFTVIWLLEVFGVIGPWHLEAQRVRIR